LRRPSYRRAPAERSARIGMHVQAPSLERPGRAKRAEASMHDSARVKLEQCMIDNAGALFTDDLRI
jgi:hypothetical protein